MGKTRSTVSGEKEESPRVEEVGEPGLLSIAPEKMLTLVCRGDMPILVCMEEADRVADCGTALLCSGSVEFRKLVEALRDEELPCGWSDDILTILRL
jgi:hypothetical protein